METISAESAFYELYNDIQYAKILLLVAIFNSGHVITIANFLQNFQISRNFIKHFANCGYLQNPEEKAIFRRFSKIS